MALTKTELHNSYGIEEKSPPLASHDDDEEEDLSYEENKPMTNGGVKYTSKQQHQQLNGLSTQSKPIVIIENPMARNDNLRGSNG